MMLVRKSVVKSCFNHIYIIIYMNEKDILCICDVPKAQVYMYRGNYYTHICFFAKLYFRMVTIVCEV